MCKSKGRGEQWGCGCSLVLDDSEVGKHRIKPCSSHGSHFFSCFFGTGGYEDNEGMDEARDIGRMKGDRDRRGMRSMRLSSSAHQSPGASWQNNPHCTPEAVETSSFA